MENAYFEKLTPTQLIGAAKSVLRQMDGDSCLKVEQPLCCQCPLHYLHGSCSYSAHVLGKTKQELLKDFIDGKLQIPRATVLKRGIGG